MYHDYAISVLQNEIDKIDEILKNGHLLSSDITKMEENRKSIQTAIYKLLKGD